MERLKEAHERMLRAAADLENYKKRAQREKEELQKFGNERLLKDLLPVLDNLDRALAAAPADDPLVAGVTLVRASFEQVLGRYGVKSFSAMGSSSTRPCTRRSCRCRAPSRRRGRWSSSTRAASP